MFRSLFLALGATCLLIGVEALALEQATIKYPDRRSPERYSVRTFDPPAWAPWSLMGGGAVVILYSFTIPRRMNG
ncbi:hypothetical protein [Adhaeretor mobilis]|uniref:Uncharacterized protein n=1 Tax=Adhaeretor mobilis TaxID=1930276 RepID=A0A517MRE9_9BACT|nr:hypothetical protein [Adhaeretor mobilis]QDS97460.1 hypothetical protein HG15A2_07210 [Adhaeretor mobilis]